MITREMFSKSHLVGHGQHGWPNERQKVSHVSCTMRQPLDLERMGNDKIRMDRLLSQCLSRGQREVVNKAES